MPLKEESKKVKKKTTKKAAAGGQKTQGEEGAEKEILQAGVATSATGEATPPSTENVPP